MCTAQKQFLKKSAVKAILLVSALAAGAFSQLSGDTAKVPVVVNVDATVSIQPGDMACPAMLGVVCVPGIGTTKTLKANKTDTLVLVLDKTTAVSHNPQTRANTPTALSVSGGRVSLNLPAQSYGNAEISMYAVDGKRVLFGRASALSAVNNISRQNVAAGVYLLSVTGVGGSSFTARHTHSGGSMNINVAFGRESAAPAGQLKKEANSLATAWTLTAQAAGYESLSRPISPIPGMNPLQTITLTSQSVASSGIGCNRAGLTAAVDAYLAALEAGDYTSMPLAASAKYYENDNSAKQNYSTGKYDKEVKFGEGLWKAPIKTDFHRNLIDVTECASFTEIIAANNNPQYVLGARLKVTGDKISEVTLVVTKTGDWGFNAKNYLSASSSKKEDTVWAKPGYIEREELRAAAYAYFAYFGDKTVNVPWGIPCTRVEGGMSTGDSPNSTCNVGVPDVKIDAKGITYLADVDYGMVVLFLYFGGADSHMFKILPDPVRYRYIHTLTAMKQSDYVAP